MQVLLAQGRQPKIVLGPTLMTTVCVEGQPVTALLDTGSLVLIVSLKVFLQILKKQRPTGQTPDQWAETVKQRLQSSKISLYHYGEDQLPSHLEDYYGNRTKRKHLPGDCSGTKELDFRLGTDLMEMLGFQLVESVAQLISVTTLQDNANTESERANGNSQLTDELPFCLQTSVESVTSKSTSLTVSCTSGAT